MNFKYVLFFTYFLCSMLHASAQNITISGKVIDANQQPIEFANIFIQDTSLADIKIGKITDSEGIFRVDLSPNTAYKIKISFIGFEKWEQNFTLLEDFDFGPIQLVSSTNELAEVLVTSERNIITRKEDKLVFNVAASPLKTGYDGLEVLQRSPNILVGDDGNITMRNEPPTILINGRISNLSGADLATFISNLRSENIKSIEIQTHLSANTDGQSSGGVINIILKKNPLGFNGNLRSNYAFKRKGFNNCYGGLNWNYGAAKWNVYGLLNFNFRENQSAITNTIDYFTLQEKVEATELFTAEINRQNIQLGFVTNLSDQHVLGIEGYTSQLQYNSKNNGIINVSAQEQNVETGNAVVTELLENQLYTTTLNYTWTLDTLNSNFKVFVDYANQKVDRPSTTASSYENELITDNTERNNSIANTLIYSAQVDLEKYFIQKFKLEAGAKLTNTDRENALESDRLIDNVWTATGRSNVFNYSEQVAAGYLSLNKNLTDDVFMEVGLRVENTNLKKKEDTDISTVSQNYTSWFPNAYLSKDLKNSRSLSLSYSKRLRRPPFYYLNNNAVKINDFRYELGNPNLIPENVHNFEISLKDKKQNFNIFLQETTEAINGIYYLEDQVAYYEKFNQGRQRQFGASYNRFGNLTKNWYVKALVRVFNRKFISEGADSFEQLTYRFYLTNNFKINSTTSIDLIGSYRSTYADAYYVSFPIYRVNLMFQKLFFNKKLTGRIYINDLFNTMIDNSERPFENFKTIRSDKWLSQQFQIWFSYNFNSKNKVNNRKNQSKNDVRRRL